jgi:hypothetical protein
MSPESWLILVNRIYYGASALAAVAAVAAIVAGAAQIQLNESISKRKDREFAEFKLAAAAKALALEKQIAETNRSAEADRLARVAIEQKLAWRAISSEQASAIVAIAANYPATRADVFLVGDSPEVNNLGQLLLSMLKAARWDTEAWSWSGIGSLMGIAVIMKPDANRETSAAASALSKALSSAGLMSIATTWPTSAWTSVPGVLNGPPFDGNRAQIRIVVGTKPSG